MCQIEPGIYRVDGQFTVRASSETAWRVLTDYDHIPQFVSSMSFSKVKEHRLDHLLLEQVAHGRFLLFSRKIHVLLKVREEPFRRINFEDISRKNFEFYAGYWSIENLTDGLSVRYSVKAKPSFAAPRYIEKKVMVRNTESLLGELKSEIMRRAQAQALRK